MTKKSTDHQHAEFVEGIKGSVKVNHTKLIEDMVNTITLIESASTGTKAAKEYLAECKNNLEKELMQMRKWAFEAFKEDFKIEGTRSIVESNKTLETIMEEYEFSVLVTRR